MADSAIRRMTVEEFLAWDDGTDTKYELIDGQPVAMAPTRRSHGQIVGRLANLIGNRLAQVRPDCSVWIGPGIRSRRRANSFFIPDLMVSCEGVGVDTPEADEPVLIVEVLSESTEATDRLVKLQDYQLVPSVREILLIDPRRVHAEVHRRLDVDRWLVHLLRSAEARLQLESVGLNLPLSELYAGIPLD